MPFSGDGGAYPWRMEIQVGYAPSSGDGRAGPRRMDVYDGRAYTRRICGKGLVIKLEGRSLPSFNV